MPGARFGVFGLAVMGQNLARNIASKGVPVAVYNRTRARTDRMIAEHGAEGDFLPAYDVASFVASIERPRPILMMVKAGEPVTSDRGAGPAPGGGRHPDRRRQLLLRRHSPAMS